MVDPAVLAIFSRGKPRLDVFLTAQEMALHEAELGFTSMVVHQQFESPADPHPGTRKARSRWLFTLFESRSLNR